MNYLNATIQLVPVSKTFTDKGIIFICILSFFIYLSYRLIEVFTFHLNISGSEGNVIYFIQRVLDGSPLYTDPSELPYSIAQYGPLYYYITAGVCKLLGISSDSVYMIFVVSRLNCLLLNFLLAGILYLIGKTIFSLSYKRSLFLSFITFLFIEGNSFGRPDSLEHVMFFASLYFFLLAKKNENNKKLLFKNIFFAALFAVFAIFSKQSAISLPIIFILFQIFTKGYRLLITFLILFISITGILLVGINALTGLREMYRNVVLGLDNGIFWGSYWRDIIFYFYSWYGCLWVFLFIIVYALIKKSNNNLYQYLGFIILGQFIITNLFALKYGATSNYFTNWWITLFIGTIIFLQWFINAANSINRNLTFLILFLFLTIKSLLVIYPAYSRWKSFQTSKSYYYSQYNLSQKIISLRKDSQPFYFLAPDSYLPLFLFRHAIIPQYDVFTLASYPRKTFNYADLNKRMISGDIELVILPKDKNLVEFDDIINTKYNLIDTFEGYHIFTFKR